MLKHKMFVLPIRNSLLPHIFVGREIASAQLILNDQRNLVLRLCKIDLNGELGRG